MERPSPTIKHVASGNEPLEGDPYVLHSHGGGVGLTESSGGPAAPAVNTNRLPLMSSSTTTTSNGVSRASTTTSPSATTTISRSTKVNDDRPSYRLVGGIEEIQNGERIQRKEMISSATTVPSRINISIDDAIGKSERESLLLKENKKGAECVVSVYRLFLSYAYSLYLSTTATTTQNASAKDHFSVAY